MDPLGEGVFRNIKVIVHLKAKPEEGGIAEVGRKPQSSICRDAPIAMNDFVRTSRGDAEIPAKLILTDAHGLQKFLQEDFSRMYCGNLRHFVHVSNIFK